jgi:peptidyl-tRNA hydrolase, PTH1 family
LRARRPNRHPRRRPRLSLRPWLRSLFSASLEADFLIAGLGNPGPEYAQTRHNVGWMVIDRLADVLSMRLESRAEGSVGRLDRKNRRLVLLKPAAFVNTSGPVVKGLAKSLGIDGDRVVIVHDDLDLEFAAVRVKLGGGSGGHRGLKSITNALGTPEFVRIRVGIGRPPGRMDPADFVLSPFKPKEQPEIELAVSHAAEAALAVVDEGVSAAMNVYNQDRK